LNEDPPECIYSVIFIICKISGGTPGGPSSSSSSTPTIIYCLITIFPSGPVDPDILTLPPPGGIPGIPLDIMSFIIYYIIPGGGIIPPPPETTIYIGPSSSSSSSFSGSFSPSFICLLNYTVSTSSLSFSAELSSFVFSAVSSSVGLSTFSSFLITSGSIGAASFYFESTIGSSCGCSSIFS
jgi:hypothetical protein